MKKIYKQGFTLIELLVVISIISLLSSVVLASVKTGRERAVLAKTVAEMKSLQLSIELYKNQFGTYPGEGVNNRVYSDPYPSNTGTYGTSFALSLSGLETTFLISNNLLTNPVLAPTYETSYALFYFSNNPAKNFIGSYIYSCGGVPVDNYIIFFSANTKKLNLPEATMTNGGTIYNATTAGLPASGSPYTYCLSG